MNTVADFSSQLAPVDVLIPRNDPARKKHPIAKPVFTRSAVTVVGIKTVVARFLPVSHEGAGNETYVDKVNLLGKQRAEFIGRKMKGIERRMHMSLFRELVELESKKTWDTVFTERFGSACIIPNHLCIACWNCALFGGLEAGTVGTFTRMRYFDTYSVEDSSDCIAMEGSEEGMGIGNQLYEDLMDDRGSATYHLYEYVKAGTTFPFITIIENPTLLDVAGYLAAIRRADGHGYGRYSANHGKFATEILAVATGFPRFSVLDMLNWANDGNGGIAQRLQDGVVRFDSLQESIVLSGEALDELESKLRTEFRAYLQALPL